MKFRDFGFFMEAVLEQIYLFSFFLNDSNYRIHAINTDAYGLQPQGFLSASHMRSYMLIHSGSVLPVDWLPAVGLLLHDLGQGGGGGKVLWSRGGLCVTLDLLSSLQPWSHPVSCLLLVSQKSNKTKAYQLEALGATLPVARESSRCLSLSHWSTMTLSPSFGTERCLSQSLCCSETFDLLRSSNLPLSSSRAGGRYWRGGVRESAQQSLEESLRLCSGFLGIIDGQLSSMLV